PDSGRRKDCGPTISSARRCKVARRHRRSINGAEISGGESRVQQGLSDQATENLYQAERQVGGVQSAAWAETIGAQLNLRGADRQMTSAQRQLVRRTPRDESDAAEPAAPREK